VKQRRRLRRLVPDQELIRRRAAGEPLRLAFDYDVAHTTLGRYFERPEVAKQVKPAAKTKRRRQLRRLATNQELIRRRAAGESLRELASDYDVAHTTLGRYFERPEVAKKLRQAAKQLRAEQRAAARRRSARRRVEQQVRRKARATGRGRAQAGARGPRTILRGDRSARDRGRQIPPLELEPFSDDWLAWYAERRLRSQIDLLNYNDAFRGIVPPLERRARERAQPSLGKPRGRQ
jgi:hypothetical protein